MLIVIHYSEIGLKGKNRTFFEKMLVSNLKNRLEGIRKVSRRYGKIIVEIEKMAEPEKYIKALSFLPGVSSFSFAEKSDLKIDNIKKVALKLLSPQSFDTFRITTMRSNKNFPQNSSEINIILGDLVRKKLDKKVNLNNPDVVLYVEISEKEAYCYTNKYSGIGGLPVGSSGKAIALLSGGIDSPVASFLAAKRGLKVVFCHILNKTMSSDREGTVKIENIVKELAKIQGDSKLYIVPFEKIQKAIISQVPAECRMIIYRRFMMKIAQALARKENIKGIITGDSIGQVASQTLDNLNCIYKSVDLPVIPPLIGMNKEEIIKIARSIGTYEPSIVPYPDCCSFMIAKHPETRGSIEKIVGFENIIENRKELIADSVVKSSIKIVL